jgi:ABC-type transporter Mla MlaB component
MAAARPSTIVFTIAGPIDCSDLPGLCERVRALLELSGAEVALCDIDELVAPDAVTIDALARLQLAARRAGCRIELRRAPGELHELLVFAGLDDVVRSAG